MLWAAYTQEPTMFETFNFRVPLTYHKQNAAEKAAGKDPRPKTWLGPSGDGVDDPDSAAVFVHRLHTTMADDLQIEMAMDELAGDVGKTVDLMNAAETTFARITDQLVAMWRTKHVTPVADDEGAECGDPEPAEPADPPEPTDDELDDLLKRVTKDPSTREEKRLANMAQAHGRMTGMLETLRISAAWPITIVQAPDGWDDIATRPMTNLLKMRLVEAFKKARRAALEVSGKA